jgi:hypothetical protein
MPVQRTSLLYFFLILSLLAMAAVQALMMAAHPINVAVLIPEETGKLIRIARPGPYIQSAAFLLALALAAWLEARGALSHRQRAPIYGIAAMGALAAALTASIGSTDFVYYIAHGYKLGVLHTTPYAPLSGLESDPVIGSIARNSVWSQLPPYCGPTFFLFLAFLVQFLPASLGPLLVGIKCIWFGLFVLFGWLLHRLVSGSLGLTRWLALCANPALWLLCLRDAHMDFLIVVILVASFLTLQRRRWMVTGILLAMAVSIKIVMFTIVPFFVWHAFINPGEEEPWGRAGRMLLGFISYIVPIYIVFNGAEFNGPLNAAVHLQACAQVFPWALVNLLQYRPWNFPEDMARQVGGVASNILLLAALAWMFIRVTLQKKPFNLPGAVAGSMAAVLLTRSWCGPWYVFWLMPSLLLLARTPKMIFAVAVFLIAYGINNQPCFAMPFTSLLFISGGALWGLRMLTAPEG